VPTWTHERAKVASLSRSRSHDDPELLTARRNLAAARLEDYVAKVVAAAPPLTPAQIDRIAVLLRPAGDA
jgi:F0F1-type ATP synthase delta subunit